MSLNIEVLEHEKHPTLQVAMHHESPAHLPIKRKLALSNFQILAGQGSAPINFSASRIFWHSFKETTGTTKAAYEITDGLNGPVLLEITLAAGESTRDFFGEYGLTASNSLYFNLITGSVKGVLSGALEEDYQESYNKVEVVNHPGALVKVDEH